jgi:hypothetical protein
VRSLVVLALVCSTARAGDVDVGASVGAGAQGAATYGALELRLDATWPGARLGFGLRGVWDDGVFRRADWARPADAVTIVRDVELVYPLGSDADAGHLALAAGGLAPAHVGRIADGYRATLDDRWRTGVRTALVTPDLELGLEIDDVLDPALIGGALAWQMAPPWGLHLAVAIDPGARSESGLLDSGPATTTVVETGASRRYETRELRVDVGVSIVAELGLGFSGVAYADGALVRGDVRFTARADARAGTGTVGSMFGPLYRIERLAHGGAPALADRARTGELDGGALGATVGAAAPAGWLELGLRARPGLGTLATAGGGVPIGTWAQAGMWLAASRADAAGVAELRVAWAHRLFSALQAARIYQLDRMDPVAVWSVTAWFGATSDR